ncbi:DUF11 domain-containing protein [Lysobacter sp. cf310]|uniref:DUF11 domain-containing protein n=1 Tax=Lysobacter sp. cf310 TaxID=1761790 RepID=UPI001113FD78|nr:DUF11 domain-containing protein [Lysobacter sp. cf310]
MDTNRVALENLPSARHARAIATGNLSAWRPRRQASLWTLGLVAICMLLAVPAQAQIQRGTVNDSFEDPANGNAANDINASCFTIFGADAVPGWETTHAVTDTFFVAPGILNSNVYCTPVTATTPNVTGRQIELWYNSFVDAGAVPAAATPSADGTQHAELNAWQNSRIYQNVCLIQGEQIGISVSHRGRVSATVGDVAEMNIDSQANTVLRMITTNNGGGGTQLCGSSASSTPGATDGAVGNPTCSTSLGTGGWRRYTANFTWTGTSDSHNIGFEAISTAAGNPAAGNFIDNMDITLRPVIEFRGATYTTREGQTVTQPILVVAGTVPAGGTTVTINIVAGGTATSPADFTVASSFTIPAGVYATPTEVTMTGLVSMVDDAVIEDNETVTLSIAAAPSVYTIGNTTTCGSAATGATTVYRILDNDMDLLTTKTTSNATPAAGGTTTFTVTYRNNTARPTVGTGTDLTVHDAVATLSDALPTGFTAFSWTCAASGTPTPACPAASGTGAITAASVTLPAGNSGAAGGVLTYTITGTVAATQCAATTNTSTITDNDTAVAEGSSVQAGFVTPAPGGTANNSAAVAVDPLCADLSVTKTNTPGVNGNVDQASDIVVSGTPTTYQLRVTNNGADAATGAVVRDTPGAGITCPAGNTVTITGDGVPVGAFTIANLTGSGITLATLASGQTAVLSFSCNVQ